ncbi:Arsenical pump-driving ATPase [Myxococcaceae bacterium]|nr:Arsenical pump-driving ATPase [Myxococcaceae bacterium]
MKDVRDPGALVRARRIVVCVGAGGVGKTTLAAAIALGAAREGHRVLVLTIDPARRLADALGVGALGNEPRAIDRDVLGRLGVPEHAALSALMLDMKRTFDDLVERFAESEEARERILGNRIYQHVSDALAGSAEYSAMEKVFEIASSGEFDRIVVDTPPSQHALDFLEAPQRLLEFLDSALVKLLLHPAFAAGRFGFRIFQRSARRVLQVIEKVSGMAFLEDVSEFLLAFEGMSEGFRERARKVEALLTGPQTGFVLAAGPAAESVAHAESMLGRLEASGVPLAGIVLNRARLWPERGSPPAEIPEPGMLDRATESLARALEALDERPADARAAASAAIAAASEYARLVRRDEESTRSLRERADRLACFYCRVPELPRDVHELDGLARISAALFGGRSAAR